MIVKKFGGTSVGSAEMIQQVGKIVKNTNDKCIVVVSAISKTTDKLVALIEDLTHNDIIFATNNLKKFQSLHLEICKELGLLNECKSIIDKSCSVLKNIIESVSNKIDLNNNQKDVILATGEILSSFICATYFQKIEIKSYLIDSRDVIKTDSNFTEAEVDISLTKQNLISTTSEIFRNNDVIVMGGFIGSDNKGRTTTIGRGGSDYSAAIAALSCDAYRLEIWTDVDGIMTIDPKINKNALRVLRLSYDEASELAYFGAKVLHPKTIGPAIRANIPVVVKNTYNPNVKGTWIEKSAKDSQVIKAISYWDNIIVINIKSNRMLGAYGFLNRVFEIFKIYETPVDLIATSEVSLSLTIDNERNLPRIISELGDFSNVQVHTNHSIISAIGEGIKETSGIASRFFGVLKDINIKMVSIGASEVNLSIVVHQSDLEKSLKRLHDEFFGTTLSNDVFERLENE